MKKRTVVLLVFFIMLFGSGIALFILSRQANVGDFDYLLSPAGNAHAVFALIVSILVILHIKGNLKIKEEYEEEIKKLQAEHKEALEKISELK